MLNLFCWKAMIDDAEYVTTAQIEWAVAIACAQMEWTVAVALN